MARPRKPWPASEYPTPKLVRLNMGLSQGSNHPDINSKDTYLCLIDGEYFVGRFSKQWYGWNFEGWINTEAGLQFDAPGTNGSDWQQIWCIKSGK